MTGLDAADLERFLQRAGHDLHEPLVVIEAYLQLLSERELDGESRELAQGARAGAERMRALLADVLAYLRALSTEPRVASMDATVALGEALKRLEPEVKASGARVEHADLPRVRADAAQLALAFHALVENAIKFRRGPSPIVRVSARREGALVRFEVQDDGIGIDARHHARLFEPFVRLHPHEEFAGSGLGLALVRRLVERLGGSVGVASAPGAGSTFFFTLPSG